MAAAEREIFREEALAHREAQKGPGDVLRVAPRWTSVAFFLLLGLVAVLSVAGSLIEVDRYAPGITTQDASGNVVVLVPAAVAPEIGEGRPVEIGSQTVETISAGEVLDPSEVLDRYGVSVTGPSVVVETSAEGTPSERARVLVGREPVLVSLIPGLDRLFGGDDA